MPRTLACFFGSHPPPHLRPANLSRPRSHCVHALPLPASVRSPPRWSAARSRPHPRHPPRVLRGRSLCRLLHRSPRRNLGSVAVDIRRLGNSRWLERASSSMIS